MFVPVTVVLSNRAHRLGLSRYAEMRRSSGTRIILYLLILVQTHSAGS